MLRRFRARAGVARNGAPGLGGSRSCARCALAGRGKARRERPLRLSAREAARPYDGGGRRRVAWTGSVRHRERASRSGEGELGARTRRELGAGARSPTANDRRRRCPQRSAWARAALARAAGALAGRGRGVEKAMKPVGTRRGAPKRRGWAPRRVAWTGSVGRRERASRSGEGELGARTRRELGAGARSPTANHRRRECPVSRRRGGCRRHRRARREAHAARWFHKDRPRGTLRRAGGDLLSP
jgi:hypothetical protein